MGTATRHVLVSIGVGILVSPFFGMLGAYALVPAAAIAFTVYQILRSKPANED